MVITALDGTGTTILFGTSGFSAKLISVDGPSMERAAIDVTEMASTAMEFLEASLSDVGSVDITFEFIGSDDPPIDAATETITIDWAGQGVGKTWAFSGFMTSYAPGAAIGERMQASATLKASGALTVS